MSNGYIKILESDTNRTRDRLKFPNMKYGRQYHAPRVTSIIADNNYVIISVHQGNNNGLYVLKEGSVLEEITKIESSKKIILTGKDNYHYYFNERSGETFKGFKFNKAFKNKTNGHLDNFPDLMIIGTLEDHDYYWYVCIEGNTAEFNVKRTPETILQLTLVSKNKLTGEFRKIKISEVGTDEPFFVDTNNYIWIFSGRKLFKFSKERISVETVSMPIRLIPFPSKSSDSSDYIWSLNQKFSSKQRELYRINKESLKIIPTPVSFSDDIIFPTFYKKYYADDNYLWLYAKILEEPGAPSGRFSPHLLRISKDDLNAEALLIKPTVGETASTIVYNFFAVLTSPLWGHKQ